MENICSIMRNNTREENNRTEGIPGRNNNVSIVIPMYNASDTIESVLSSIEKQTAKSNIVQVVIVDDGSQDDSTEKVNNYSQNSTLPIELIHKKNGGVSSARNIGMGKVKYFVDWIAFCDSDDLWLPEKLEKQLEVLNNNSEIDCLGTQYSERKLKLGTKSINSLYKASVKDILICNFPQPSTVIMKKKIFDEMGGFDENQRFAEDGNYFLHVAAYYNLYYLPELLIHYGFGKRGFGISGLSANLKGMHLGNIKNLKDMHNDGFISNTEYLLFRILYALKYCRRVVLSAQIRG